ncbi:MAG: apolipoprotein N-acyltransferase [Candidatus Eremiobacteraeota bacterium]|nr:apolipoprotein N-acyltransferase [Candidatus Eremiobacteraeota bacterium]
MLSSERARSAGVAALGAILLALAFPRTGIAWVAPLGAAALFLAWEGASWKRSFAIGWFAGWIFFTISFWWWTTTIQTVVGSLAYAAVIVAAAIEAFAFGAAALLGYVARTRALPALAPLATAAAFAIMEWMRSIGPIGVPFAQLGYTQAGTPLRALAAYIGTNGVTFVLCVVGAYAADAVARRTWRPFAVAVATIAAATIVAWGAWPARDVTPPSIPVAAVQGNITQTLKWQPGALQEAIDRYESMTHTALARDPKLIVWPETVIAIANGGLNQRPDLLNAFTDLARQGNTTLVAGSLNLRNDSFYNSLFLFTPQGLTGTYDKRQLVPFAEHFPGQQWLWWLPYIGELNGHFAEGNGAFVFPTTAGVTIGPLICWESAFADLAYAEVHSGAQVLVVATDDAWFGTTSGPYQHAQIAQLRAIEAGEYVVRAAATGISGVIAPDGTWQARAPLEEQRVVFGMVGKPVGSVFSHIGPTFVWIAMLLAYVFLIFVPGRRRAI